jgi:hypothetical protein
LAVFNVHRIPSATERAAFGVPQPLKVISRTRFTAFCMDFVRRDTVLWV